MLLLQSISVLDIVVSHSLSYMSMSSVTNNVLICFFLNVFYSGHGNRMFVRPKLLKYKHCVEWGGGYGSVQIWNEAIKKRKTRNRYESLNASQ